MTVRTHAIRGAAISGTLALSVLALPGTAHADTGNVKVHAQGTDEGDNRDEPKPGCAFYIIAYSATPGATFRVTFAPQGGDNVAGEPTTATDDYKTDKDFAGNPNKKDDGRSRLFNQNENNPEIKNGKYKITITNLANPNDTETKVFTVSGCTGGGGPDPDPSPTPDASPTPDPDDPDNPNNPNNPNNPDDNEVGGVDLPGDEDDGAPGVGGVATGGGGLANPTNVDVAVPLLITALGGAFVAAKTLRRRGSD